MTTTGPSPSTVRTIRLNSTPIPGIVLDPTPTYRLTPSPGYGRPEVESDGNQALVAVLDLTTNPFAHPQAYLKEHRNHLLSATLEAALALRRGQPRTLDPRVKVVTIAPSAIEGPWDDWAAHGIAV